MFLLLRGARKDLPLSSQHTHFLMRNIVGLYLLLYKMILLIQVASEVGFLSCIYLP